MGVNKENPRIVVSEYAKHILDNIRVQDKHTTFDSVERMLLYRTGYIPVIEPEKLTPRMIYDCKSCKRSVECLSDPLIKETCMEIGTRIFEMTKRLDKENPNDETLTRILNYLRDYGVLDAIVTRKHLEANENE